MSSADAPPIDYRYADMLMSLSRDLGAPLGADTRVLDLGCGEGRQVRALRHRGVNAVGADVRDRGAAMAEQCVRDGVARPGEQILSVISLHPYRLPYDDASIDVVFSSQVLEHVQDWPSLVAELDRVLAPNGIAIHIFPSRYRIVEAHVFVPFASIFQGQRYLSAWALAGIRTKLQRGRSWRQVAAENHEYLTTRTNYLGRGEMLALVRPQFPRAFFAESVFLRHTYGGARRLRTIQRWFPPVARLFSAMQRRVLVFQR